MPRSPAWGRPEAHPCDIGTPGITDQKPRPPLQRRGVFREEPEIFTGGPSSLRISRGKRPAQKTLQSPETWW
ncbi:MAG: hypothetical protein DRH20_07285 [Deltaproteobacteria bacterium]|nr:MAG: hypothetical protein DRH20_07285 [Deltaproteobacteria bacterium]